MNIKFPLALSLLVLCAIRAAVAAEPLTGGLPQAAADPTDGIYRRTLLLRPKAATNELRSALYPSRDKWQRGFAAPIFLRQNFEATAAMKVLRETFVSKFWELPLEKLPVNAVRTGAPLRWNELRRAAFRERAGWEYPIDEERAAFILLPDVQESRLYVDAILLTARADLKEDKVADAIDKICIAMGLARHIGETPFAVCRLVQRTHVDRALSVIEELIQHPASDNQYWSLTALPRPLIATQDAMQYELSMLAKTFPALANSDSRLTEEEWRKVAREVVDMVRMSNSLLPQEGTPEAKQLLDRWLVRSRERLPQLRPDWAERVPRMSDAEVGTRYWYELCQSRSAWQCALGSLEYHRALPRLAKEEARLNQHQSVEEQALQAPILSPGALVRAAAATDQRVALLRTVEAIRDWSAKRNGELPESLDQLDVPAPLDCLTNTPFTYQVAADGKSATLAGAVLEHTQRQPNGPTTTIRRGYEYHLKTNK